MKPIVMHRKAREELDRAIGYYERQTRGLGLDLHAEIQKAISTIQEYPKLGSPYKNTDFRFSLVRRFPYVIYYADLPEFIWVVAIGHGSRKPGYWKKRRIE